MWYCNDLTSLDYKSVEAKDIQIGTAQLTSAGSAAHLEIVRRWLRSCDSRAYPCKPGASAKLPKRLIQVGKAGDDTVNLRETTSQDSGEWIALSHQWGKRNFSTTQENLDDHIAGMKFEDLPATFKDAVTVTRALGHQYLWIDSLCIVQGKGGDFDQEAKRMEEYYSGANCVIAASCSADHYSGFLKGRKERDSVTLCRQESTAPFHVCQLIDDFQGHVLNGDLHRRGWVLQEHALARRTIFFTKYQTYWECGHGIRCETMTTLSK